MCRESAAFRISDFRKLMLIVLDWVGPWAGDGGNHINIMKIQ